MSPLPFSVEQFFAVFAAYNRAVWPAQWALYGVALAVIGLVAFAGTRKDRWINGLLALLWAWMAVAYHLVRFTRINPAAYLFAAAFALQAILLLWASVRGWVLGYSFARGWRSATGVALLAYALVAYPLLNVVQGHSYPATPTFGVPCPTTIFSFGVLATAAQRRPALKLLVVPLLWSVIGGSAAVLLDVPADLGLLAAAVLGLAAATWPGIRRGGEHRSG